MFMFMCLDGTTQRPVSKLTEENKALNEIGNWTPTPMETHGIHFCDIYLTSIVLNFKYKKKLPEMVK